MSDKIITIDGRKLPFVPGETILDVTRRNGIFIPTLCHLRGTTPTGACRICVVEVEGGRVLAPACTSPAAPNMVIHTNSSMVNAARRTVLAFLLMSGNHNCAAATRESPDWTEFEQQVEGQDQSMDLCPAHSACKLQAYAYRYQVDTRGLVRRKIDYPIEMASPLIVRDFSRCILCGRCVEACNVIQANMAISHGFRGNMTKIVAMGDSSLERSECVFCGECIQACPVAALTEKKSRYRIRPWEARHVRTTCHYCGTGCQLDLHIKNDIIMKVTGVEDALPNLGRLCVKGRFGFDFLQSPQRLTRPMIRDNGKLREASWDEALTLVASKIKEIKEASGPEAIAGISSAKSTNESLYLMQKLFRSAIGSNHLASPYAAYGLNNPLGELEGAKGILLIGSDVTEENPVAGTFIKRAANRGCPLIVVDSHPTKIARFASLHLLVKEGTEQVLINGIIHGLLGRGRGASEEIKEAVTPFPIDRVLETTGLGMDQMNRVMDLLDAQDPFMLVYGPKVASGLKCFILLQELLGNLGKAYGGVNLLSPMNNSQGACDMGVLPHNLTGHIPVDDEAARKPFESAWGCSLNGNPGYSLSEIIHNAAGNGAPEKRIRMIYCVGEDLTLSKPFYPDVIKALKSLDFLVVQHILDNDMLQYAHVVLPAVAWAEEDGTYTNCERRVSRVRCAVPGPGEAKPETWIFTQLAKQLGKDWPHTGPQDVWEKEIAMLLPAFKGITYSRIEDGGLQWPVPDTESQGTACLDGSRPPICPGPSISFNYHHRSLLEHCEGLLESISPVGGGGKRIPPGNVQEVTQGYLDFLKEEDKIEATTPIDEILRTYRHRKGGLIPVLQKVQGILGFLPVEVQNYVALGLGLPPSDVFGVVTFYHFFTMVPRGRHIVRVCLGTACFVKGSANILENLERHLKVTVGETTEDREYSLDVVRCLGACGLAPVMVVDEVTHGELDPRKVVEIIESYRGRSEEI
ncbi:MAG: molybdopterin-dependent oxidoreductase [Pseudomonadota bacterium]